MLRLSRVSPFKLPGIFGVFGPFRSESFLGQLQGHDLLRLGPQGQLFGTLGVAVDPQPYVWGQKIDFHPTPNFQFGASATAIFAGYGRPLTLDTFLHTFTLHGGAQAIDPGKRTGGFDFSYRIPHLRNWLTLCQCHDLGRTQSDCLSAQGVHEYGYLPSAAPHAA
jgi:hypothetical protein